MGKRHNSKDKKAWQRDQELKTMRESSSRLGGENQKLQGQVKAHAAELEGCRNTIDQLTRKNEELESKVGELNSRPPTVIEVAEPWTKVFENIYDKKTDHELDHAALEEARAEKAIEYQRRIGQQQLDQMEREIQIRKTDPAVIEGHAKAHFKRIAHLVCLIMGSVIVCASLYYLFLNPAATVVALGLMTPGLGLLLIGVVPYISATDADKVNKLWRLFKGKNQGLPPGNE